MKVIIGKTALLKTAEKMELNHIVLLTLNYPQDILTNGDDCKGKKNLWSKNRP